MGNAISKHLKIIPLDVQFPAAETKVSSIKTTDIQRYDTESTIDSFYLKTCLKTEIDPMFLAEANLKVFVIGVTTTSRNSSSEIYWNRSSKV
jgi:hypothetical protein